MNVLLTVWLAAHGCDAATTHIALNSGGIERNPLYTQSAVTNDVLMASEAAAVAFAFQRFGPQHPKLTKVLLVAGIALSGYAAVHNVQTIHTLRR